MAQAQDEIITRSACIFCGRKAIRSSYMGGYECVGCGAPRDDALPVDPSPWMGDYDVNPYTYRFLKSASSDAFVASCDTEASWELNFLPDTKIGGFSRHLYLGDA